MKRRHIARSILAGLFLAIAFESGGYASAAPLRAAGFGCKPESSADLRHSGRPDLMTLRCDLAGSGAFDDRITILDRNGDLNPQVASWQNIGDFSDDVWIFDYKADDKPELVIDYHHNGSGLVADLFDVPDNADHISYDLAGGNFKLDGLAKPTVEVVAPDGWWTHGDTINYNLDIAIDGLVDGAFGIRERFAGVFTTDGNIDIVAHIRDTNHNGRPDYDWRTVAFHNTPYGLRALTPPTYLMVNARDDEAPLDPIFPWPYLGRQTYGYLNNSAHSVSEPPIQIDWAAGKITAVGEFVSSRGNDGQWFVYSFNTIQAGQLNHPNFENPFAWYDLADDHDRTPELAVRFSYSPPNDPDMLYGEIPHAVETVRYSWDQNNDGFWDYKLGLLGTNTVSSVVSLPDFDMNLLPYSAAPSWVVNHTWGPATFVAAEQHAIGEGIYVWDPPAWLTEGYFAGRAARPEPGEPVDASERFDTIKEGFRGEVQFAHTDQPWLYLSAVDHKLHMRQAQQGIWKIDGHSGIEYANLRGGDYIDQWTYTKIVTGAQTLATTRQLNIADDQIVYSDNDKVVIRQAKAAPSLFETLPPASHAEWQALGAKIEAAKRDFPLGDLYAMMQQFDGPEMQISGARLRDYRPVGAHGFRFVLDLAPGAQAQGADLLPLPSLAPATYAVTYDGSFRVAPLTPPAISASLPQLSVPNLQTSLIPVALRNDGLTDLRDAQVELWATSPQHVSVVMTQTLTLPAQASATATFQWAPRADGVWTLTPKIYQTNGDRITLQSASATILPAQKVLPADVLGVATSPKTVVFAVLGLAVVACIVALAVHYQLNSNEAERIDDTE